MKILFLVFHGFQAYNGISKKIRYQIDAMKACGADVRTCYYEVQPDGHRQWLVDDEVIADLGTGITAKLKKRIDFSPIVRYIEREGIDMLYLRSFHNANPFTINLVRKIHQLGVKIIFEIPTYPYDQEYATLKEKFQITADRLFRKQFCKYVDRIVTFSNDDTIFGCPTIRISNGIDFNSIPLRTLPTNRKENEIHLIAVAEIHFWHGFDRLIHGLGKYYQTNPPKQVYLHLVGDFFGTREKEEILTPIKTYGLEKHVICYGNQSGEALNNIFNQCDFAIGSLARHRSGITHIKTLKNREYAARGFGFIYSETDDDFEQMPYILKVPADESPIDVPQLITFYQQLSLSPETIRSSIQHLSWKEQMKQVISSL